MSFRVGLDGRMIGHSGIGVTIRGLLENWSADRLSQVTLYAPPGWSGSYACQTRTAPEKIYGLSQHIGYGRRLNGDKLDLYHMPHFDVPLSYRGPLVATIHDLIHVHFPEHSTKPLSRLYASLQIRRVVKRAARIITVSENTRDDIERFAPGAGAKTTVLYPAAGETFRPLPPEVVEPVLSKYGLTRGYFLYVGNIRGSKNSLRLIAAYQALKKSAPDAPPMVMVGHNTYKQFEGGFPDGIRHVAGVPFADLPALYNGALAFAFPSIYEGFGLPPLEAMACGVPVVVSNAASLPEVCGDAGVYVDPKSEDGIAAALKDLWLSPSRRDALSARGLARAKRFSWSTFAEGTWRVYEQAVR